MDLKKYHFESVFSTKACIVGASGRLCLLCVSQAVAISHVVFSTQKSFRLAFYYSCARNLSGEPGKDPSIARPRK